jgi:hypothetical protein
MGFEVSSAMIYGTDYIVVLCGYEGVEDIFGPFSYNDALVFHNELKTACTKEYDTTYDYETPDSVLDLVWETAVSPDHRISLNAQYYYCSNIKDEIAETKYGLDSLPHDSDQVCIMKPDKKRRLVCCCEDFPDRIKNKKMWLMG